MKSTDVISKTTKPVTKADWLKLLKQLNLASEELLIVYTDLLSYNDYYAGSFN